MNAIFIPSFPTSQHSSPTGSPQPSSPRSLRSNQSSKGYFGRRRTNTRDSIFSSPSSLRSTSSFSSNANLMIGGSPRRPTLPPLEATSSTSIKTLLDPDQASVGKQLDDLIPLSPTKSNAASVTSANSIATTRVSEGSVRSVLPVVCAPVVAARDRPPPRPPRRSLPSPVPVEGKSVLQVALEENATPKESENHDAQHETEPKETQERSRKTLSRGSSLYHTAGSEFSPTEEKELPDTPPFSLTNSRKHSLSDFQSQSRSESGESTPVLSSPQPGHVSDGKSAHDRSSRRQTKRQHSIRELIETEAAYAKDLLVIVLVYLARAQGASIPHIQLQLVSRLNITHTLDRRRSSLAQQDITSTSNTDDSPVLDGQDSNTIFLNVQALADFSYAFVDHLRSSVDGQAADANTGDSIGSVFLTHAKQIHKLYEFYITRYDSALRRLEEIEAIADAGWQTYVKETASLASPYTSSWNLNALLIKPVQRCLKYPLLLEAIIQHTEDGHPDMPNLREALAQSKETARALNESRRARELVSRIVYKQQRKGSASGRQLLLRTGSASELPGMAKVASGKTQRASPSLAASPPLSTQSTFKQSFAKQFNRSGQKIKLAAGFKPREISATAITTSYAVDLAMLDHLLHRFKQQQTAFHQLLLTSSRWIASLDGALDQLRNLAWAWIDYIAPLNGEAQIVGGPFEDILSYAKVVRKAQVGPVKAVRTWFEENFTPAVERLLLAFEGPQAVIDRRLTKLLDAQRNAGRGNSLSTDRRNSEHSDDLDYLALTATLCRELPVFLKVTGQFFDNALLSWSQTQCSAYSAIHSMLVDFQESTFQMPANGSTMEDMWRRQYQSMADVIASFDCVSADRMNGLVSAALQGQTTVISGRTISEENFGAYFSEMSRNQSQPITTFSGDSVSSDQLSELMPPPRRRHLTSPVVDDDRRASGASSSASFAFSNPSRTSTVPSSIGNNEFDDLPVLFSAVAIDDTSAAAAKEREGLPILGLTLSEEVEVLGDEEVDGVGWAVVRRQNGQVGYVLDRLIVALK